MLLFEVVLPMINQVYQLVAPRQFEVTYNNVDIYSDYVIVRPLYMSICLLPIKDIILVAVMRMSYLRNCQCL